MKVVPRAEYVYTVLLGEAIKKDMNIDALAELLHIGAKAMRNKLKGETDFWWSEVVILHKTFPDIPLEELLRKNAA